MNEHEHEPRIAVSVEMKVNLGNYESAGASIVVSGLHAGATSEEIEQLLDTGKVAYDLMKVRLGHKISDLRRREFAGEINNARP